MRKLFLVFAAILISASFCNAQRIKEGQFPSGIIYGPKGAYKIDAPKNWILDNKAGLQMNLPCVLYLNGWNWQNSPVVMYAKIAGINFENIDKFIEFAIGEFKKQDPKFFHKELRNGKIAGQKYVIMDYIGGPYRSYQRVFYIQMDKAVGYVVFTSKSKEDFDRYADAVFEISDSYKYSPEYINYQERK
jgi:hypothetical protein